MTKDSDSNPEIYYRSYGDLLEVSDKDQIDEHLEHVNEKGELTELVTGIINYFIDNADSKENAEKADLALRKLATILDHLEVEQIEEIIGHLHNEEVAEKLTKLLGKDIDRLIAIFHSRQDEKTLVKICFLMNFLDQKTLLRILGTLSAEDLQAIMENPKAKKLFDKVMEKFLKMRGDLGALFEKFPGFLNMALSFEPDNDIGIDIDAVPTVIEACLDPHDEFLQMIMDNKMSLAEMNLIVGTKPFLVLKLVEHYDKLPVDLKEAFKSNVVPSLMEFPLGRVCVDRIAKQDPALFQLVSKVETMEQAESLIRQYSYNLSGTEANSSVFRDSIAQLDSSYSKYLGKSGLKHDDMLSKDSVFKESKPQGKAGDEGGKDPKEGGKDATNPEATRQSEMFNGLKAEYVVVMKGAVDRVLGRGEAKGGRVKVEDAKKAGKAPTTSNMKREELEKMRR